MVDVLCGVHSSMGPILVRERRKESNMVSNSHLTYTHSHTHTLHVTYTVRHASLCDYTIMPRGGATAYGSSFVCECVSVASIPSRSLKTKR